MPPSRNNPASRSPHLDNILNRSGECGSPSPSQGQHSQSASRPSPRGRGTPSRALSQSSRAGTIGARSRASSRFTTPPRPNLSSNQPSSLRAPARSAASRFTPAALNALAQAGLPTRAAGAAAGSSSVGGGAQPGQPLSRPTRHTDFVEIKIHTAKCDICNQHNKAILRRCCDCGWQICTPCWDARGGDGRHGTRRPFMGEVFNPNQLRGETSKKTNKDKDGGEDVATGAKDDMDTRQKKRKTIDLTKDDDDNEYEEAAESTWEEWSLISRQRELRPRQKRNYAELSDIDEEQEDAGDGAATVSIADNGDESVRDVPQASETATPSNRFHRGESQQLTAPETESERRWFYLVQAAEEAYQEVDEDRRRSPLFLSTERAPLQDKEPSTPTTPLETMGGGHDESPTTHLGTSAQVFSRRRPGSGPESQ